MPAESHFQDHFFNNEVPNFMVADPSGALGAPAGAGREDARQVRLRALVHHDLGAHQGAHHGVLRQTQLLRPQQGQPGGVRAGDAALLHLRGENNPREPR